MGVICFCYLHVKFDLLFCMGGVDFPDVNMLDTGMNLAVHLQHLPYAFYDAG